MEKSKSILLIIFISISLSQMSCKKKEVKPNFFNDEDFHFALYTNPSSDCIDCILKALRALDVIKSPGEPLYIFIKKSPDKERFINFVKSELISKSIIFFDYILNAPSPSIILMRKNNIYMWLYIQNDPYEFDLYIKKCLQLLAKFQ